ncbi:hypothetical protein FQZ97_685670 [compost metagenome]
MPLLDFREHQFGAAIEQGAHFHRLRLQLLTATLDARQVENVIDQRRQVTTGIHYLAGIIRLLLGLRLVLRLQFDQLAKTINGVQWRAQLMAHARQKTALGLTG